MKIGVCSWVLPGDEIEAFRIASEAGIEGVVINYGFADHDNLEETELVAHKYLEEAKKYNVEIPTMALNIFCGLGITKVENEDQVRKILDQAISIAVTMGIEKLQIPSFFNSMIRTSEDMDQTIEVYKYACNQGERNNIMIGSESVMTILQHQRLVAEVNSSHLMTMFDTQNPWQMLNQNGVRMAQYMAPMTGELHAKDCHINGPKKLQLGEGDVRFFEIMEVFREAAYDGWIHLEDAYNTMDGFEEILKADVEILKQY